MRARARNRALLLIAAFTLALGAVVSWRTALSLERAEAFVSDLARSGTRLPETGGAGMDQPSGASAGSSTSR